MCGIAAAFYRNPTPSLGARLDACLDMAAHRGPDGKGMILGEANRILKNGQGAPTWGLGHVRLAILDLSPAGHQPMSISNERFWISYNGEVYNYVEIRSDLAAEGYTFRGTSDTEVILAAYQQWGPACVKRFNGMFAFVILDLYENRVFIARDRLGVKPLYLWRTADKLIIVSEPKQLLAFQDFRPRCNKQQVVDFLVDSVVGHESDSSFFENVRPLPAAHLMTWNLGRIPETDGWECYWRPATTTRKLSWEDAVESTGTILREAVRLRLRSDVPVGSCLSGGLDSSSIVGIASRELGHRMNTFSSCFNGFHLDEQYYIDSVNEYCGTKSFKVFPDPEQASEELESLAYHQDEPFGSLSVYAQWCVMRSARGNQVPVLLDGQGGDEAFCGYKKYAYFLLRHFLANRDYRLAMSHAFTSLIQGDKRLLNFRSGLRYLPSWLRVDDHAVHDLLRPGWRPFIRKIWKERMRGVKTLHEMQLWDLQAWSLPALLRYEDRNSMAHSIETRLPFLDYRFVEHVLTMPERFFYRRGRSKRLLVTTLGNTLAPQVAKRKTKVGFEVPEAAWMEREVGQCVADRVLKSQRLATILDPGMVSKLFAPHGNGSKTNSLLFRIASLGLWLERFGVDVDEGNDQSDNCRSYN